jgi:hypothetical protein
MNVNRYRLSFLKAQQWARHGAVDADCRRNAAGKPDWRRSDIQIEQATRTVGRVGLRSEYSGR